METGTFKGIEFILILGLVGWFYFSQMGKLKKLKEEREAKRDAASSETTSSAPKSD